MTSIIIPAYNEGAVIERCLGALLDGARPDEFEVVVVCNGCTDDTALRARRFAGVTVLETPVGSKVGALNLGDRHARSFPRFYVDADIELRPEDVRAVADLLGDESPIVVGAPRAVVAFQDRPALVRSFYRVWTALPYFRENMIGSGVYAFSRRGRERFGEFPDIIADDEYARLMAAPEERGTAPGATFVIRPPRSLRGVVDILTRARAGNYELRARFPELSRHDNTGVLRTLREIARAPQLWADAPLYLGVMFVAKVRAHRKLRARAEKVWERDETSRQQS